MSSNFHDERGIDGAAPSAGTELRGWIYHFQGLAQERRNSSALAMELRLSCTNSSIS